jgi:hypothetical protein
MRKLNYDVLESPDANVTLGFKINSQSKFHLAKSAEKEGKTLSKYINEIVTGYISDTRILQNELALLKNKLTKYENDVVRQLYLKHKGLKIVFESASGVKEEVVVKDESDIFNIITKPFKPDL